ncbi:hypothetical protein PEC106568_38030 [Pectobacterium carotovorum subsp. carotovorum]|nr:hypothetical protein PEC106568_38030 [Pectobacterium carotovorum subsp. carotovorum]
MTHDHPIWLQGHVLTDSDALNLGLRQNDDHLTKVVVISHDCDIQSGSDPQIELIVGKLVKTNNQFKKSKHPRILHLCYEKKINQRFNTIELRHIKKVSILKSDFKVSSPCEDYPINPDEKRALKQWLAAKYGRPAFPDSFEQRMRAFDDPKEKVRFENQIADTLRESSEYLLGLYFDLGENRFNELPEGEPYELSIYAVYDAERGWTKAQAETTLLCKKLKEQFEYYYGTPDRAQLISLENCEAIADTEFTLSSLRKMDHWRVEYISLEDDSQGDFIGSST